MSTFFYNKTEKGKKTEPAHRDQLHVIILYIILLFLSGNRDMQLLQLFVIHLSGRLCHQTGSILHLPV